VAASNPIPDPGLTEAEAQRALKSMRTARPAPGFATCAEEETHQSGIAKLEAALKAPAPDNSGVEKAVEELAERLAKNEEVWSWDRHPDQKKDFYRDEARGHVEAIRPLLTQQPVLLSDEEREHVERCADILEAVSPPIGTPNDEHVAFLRKLAQHHVPTKGQGERDG